MSANSPCPNCGHLNRPGAKMCARCGKPLSAQSASPTPPPPPPASRQPQPPPASQPPRPAPVPPPPPRQQSAPPPPPPASGGQPPRQQPVPPPSGAQSPLPPPRKPVPPKPARLSRLSLSPLQMALVGVSALVLCLCLALLGTLNGLFGLRRETPTTIAVIPTTVQSPTQTVGHTPATLPTNTPIPPTSVPTQLPASPLPPTIPPIIPATPTLTLAPTPTPTAKPTNTATPSPTLAPDTPITATLEVGQTWYQQNMALTLSKATFAAVSCGSLIEFDLTLSNNETTSPELLIGWRGEDIKIVDDQKKAYDLFFQPAPRTSDCAKYKPINEFVQPALASKVSVTIPIAVRGALPPEEVKAFIVTVGKAGRIQNATWKISVPR